MDDRIYVGLGNPGKKYENTRHNIGFQVVQKYAEQLGVAFKEENRFQAQVAKGVDRGRKIHIVLPQTYMNESGISIRRYLDFYQLPMEALVVIVDDIALAFGEIRLRPSGSAGGHNGLKSIQIHLGTQDYKRLRMGVGSPVQRENILSDYVLSPFSMEEKAELPAFIERGTEILRRLLDEDVERVMNDVNTRKLPVKGQEKQNGE